MLREHFTAAGEPKKRLTIEEAYRLAEDYPERNLSPYECDICGWWHVGESRIST